MAVEDECHCSDTSEPSNVTSLRSDISSIINCSGLNRTSVVPNDNNDCTCQPVQFSPPNVHPPPVVCSVLTPTVQPTCQMPLPNCQPVTQCEPPPVTCHCHTFRATTCSIPMKRHTDPTEARASFLNRLHGKWSKRGKSRKHDKTYQVKLKKGQCQFYPKAYMCCEVTEGIPKQKKCVVESIELPENRANSPDENSERIDIYYFDHGNSAYYRTTDSPPIITTEKCAERTDYLATRFWAEIFGTIHMGFAFVTTFILQLLRFILFSIVRPLTVGILQLLADYWFKPILSIVFNATIQPILILLYNIATSFRDLCEPLAEALGFFLREIAQVCRAFRIVEVNNITTTTNNGCT